MNLSVSTMPHAHHQEKRRNQGGVIWLTGLSGSGKSTLARGLEQLLVKENIRTFLLDGDHLRRGLCSDLGFCDQDRKENIRRTGEVAKLFAQADFLVLCALISPFHLEREQVRDSCLQDEISFLEIFVDAPLSVCEARDPRGLYARVRAGEIAEFTGIHSPYEAPRNPDLLLKTDLCSSSETLQELHAFVQKWLRTIGPRRK